MKTFFAWRIIQMLICFNAVFVFPFLLNAQNEPPQQARITGQVLEKESGEPLEAVALIINELDQFSITDKDGRFIFETIPPGKITINAQCLGMVEVFEEIQIDEYKEYEVVIEMERSSLSLEEVQVIAKSSRSGLSSSSDISKAAIEHLQASSLGDILQLIPGQLADNPDLSQANQISLRQVGEDKLNALGTSIIVDGSPLSNNANLQASNPAFGGTSGYAGTVSGGGIDLRQISTENIESITVIRGIPSVEHGDLTSGALLVETRAGRTPYQARVRVNPRINQINLGKGFDFGDNAGSLNIDVDYLESVNDQRMEYMGYDRLTGQLAYSNQFFDNNLSSTTTLSGFTTLDESRQDPDDLRYQRERYSQDRGFRFNTTGRWSPDKRFAQNLRYNFSVSYTHQDAFNQQLLSGYVYPLSFAREDTTMAASIVPSEYLSQVTIDGKPLNIFARINNSFNRTIFGLNNRFMIGAEWRTDGNYGDGRMYDVTRPPRMGNNQASRPRSYKDIPMLNQLAFYLEHNINGHIKDRELAVQVGLRFDNVQPEHPFRGDFGTFLGPRINASYEIFNNFKLHGGYGLTSKSPTLVHLYPNPAYFDLVNFNHYAENPDERLIIVTTRVFDTENPGLKMAQNTKQEIGLEYEKDKRRVNITAFKENHTNGYSFYNQLEFIPLDIYEADEFPEGEPPILKPEPVRQDTFIATYNRPMNKQRTINQGLEMELDMGRINAIRTSFSLNGAYINTRRYNTGYDYWINPSMPRPNRVAVFPGDRGTENTRLNTALRVVHNIPEFQFLVSLTVQTIWIEQTKSIGYDDYEIINAGTSSERAVQPPIAYIGKDGQWVELDRQQAMDPQYRDIRRSVPDYHRTTLDYPPLWLFNIRLSKDIREGFGFAFYANNMFMHRPLHYNARTNRHDRRNPEIFFGTEMYIKF